MGKEQMQVIMGSQNMNRQRQILLVLTSKCLKNQTHYLPRQLADVVVDRCDSAKKVKKIVDVVAVEAFNDVQEEEVVDKIKILGFLNNFQ